MLNHLNLALVHSLQVLLEEGSFRKAALRLSITPPALTQQIKRLESALGYAVVDRGHHPATLTSRGEVFMLHAREALESSNQALGKQRGISLRIGFISGYPRSQDEGFLSRFRRHNPEVLLDFVQLDWGDQISRLLAGDVDASLARPPYEQKEGFDRAVVFREPRVVALPADSDLAGKGSLVLADVQDLPVVRARGIVTEWTRYWVVDPRPDGTPVNYGAWAGTMEEALAVVAMSNNIMITAESIAIRYAHPGVVYLPLDDVAYCHVELCTRLKDRRAAIRALRLSAE